MIFGKTPPDGYKREFDDRGVWYKPDGRGGRWWHTKFPSCEVEPCGGCGWFFSTTLLYSGSLPMTPAAIRARDWGDYRHVCRGCANRHDALHRRWYLFREIKSLIGKLEREIANARRKKAA